MAKTQQPRREFWQRLIAQQEQSGLSVRAFCRQQGVNEHSFYQWRKRLGERPAVKFALVETGTAPGASALELILVSGERLRIDPGFDHASFRAVLSVLREGR